MAFSIDQALITRPESEMVQQLRDKGGRSNTCTIVALIDELSFSRDIISQSLVRSFKDLAIGCFGSKPEAILGAAGSPCLIIFYAHKAANQKIARILEAIAGCVATQVLVITDEDASNLCRLSLEGLRKGICGFVFTHNTSLEQLIAAIKFVHNGGIIVPTEFYENFASPQQNSLDIQVPKQLLERVMHPA